MSKLVCSDVAPLTPMTCRKLAEAVATGTEATRREPLVARECGTCGATFPSEDELHAHLIVAFHGFQCLRCGALYTRRGDHTCPW